VNDLPRIFANKYESLKVRVVSRLLGFYLRPSAQICGQILLLCALILVSRSRAITAMAAMAAMTAIT